MPAPYNAATAIVDLPGTEPMALTVAALVVLAIVLLILLVGSSFLAWGVIGIAAGGTLAAMDHRRSK